MTGREGFEDSEVVSGQWLKFCDINGLGYAQPDFYLVGKNSVLLWECKLTQNAEAWRQLKHLYGPLLHLIYELPVVKIQVCRNVVEVDEKICIDPNALIDGATIHWLG